MTPLTTFFPALARLAEADLRGVFSGGTIQRLSNGQPPSAENTTYLCESQYDCPADPEQLVVLARRLRRAWGRELLRTEAIERRA